LPFLSAWLARGAGLPSIESHYVSLYNRLASVIGLAAKRSMYTYLVYAGQAHALLIAWPFDKLGKDYNCPNYNCPIGIKSYLVAKRLINARLKLG
jgi:hypothetical protein